MKKFKFVKFVVVKWWGGFKFVGTQTWAVESL